MIDTGSSVNMLPARLHEKIEPTDKLLKMWNHTQFSPFGKSKQSVLNRLQRELYTPSGFEGIKTDESDQRVHSEH